MGLRANGRVGGNPQAMRDSVKAFRRPPAVRLRDRNGGFPRLSDGPWLSDGAHGFRCPASLCHALLAESLGKPSLWVIINAPWYKYPQPFHGDGRRSHGRDCIPRGGWLTFALARPDVAG